MFFYIKFMWKIRKSVTGFIEKIYIWLTYFELVLEPLDVHPHITVENTSMLLGFILYLVKIQLAWILRPSTIFASSLSVFIQVMLLKKARYFIWRFVLYGLPLLTSDLDGNEQ